MEVPVAFNDASFNFSEEEWKSLNEWQKELYRHIMKESLSHQGRGNILILFSCADAAISKPDLLTRIEQGEDPNFLKTCAASGTLFFALATYL
uniref:KRAB domain-containing protein n=1 Tax=Junco hyemalis TaxID=40217 RepID=A0A8C5J9G0_JUNHY